MRLRLVDDVRQAWKWSSVRFLALGAVVQTTIVTTPDAVKDHVPDWILQGMSTFALLCIVAAGIGRITTTEPKNGDSNAPVPDQSHS